MIRVHVLPETSAYHAPAYVTTGQVAATQSQAITAPERYISSHLLQFDTTLMNRPAQYDKNALIECGHGRLFDGDMRLPIDQMLMFDRIIHISDQGGAYGKGEIVAELDIRPDLWFFHCHFHQDPVMPGCLGLDAMWQLIGFFLAWNGGEGRGRALGVGEVRFFGQVLPKNRLVRYRLDIRRQVRRGLEMAVADGRMEVDDREIYSARSLKVCLFQSMDAFKGSD